MYTLSHVSIVMLTMNQEKLNEAVVVLNKQLQVSFHLHSSVQRSDSSTGNQHSEYERGISGTNVQELPVERAVSP